MSEGATGNMLSELNAITECSICTETFQDPRILPCIHTFCLKCMQQMAKRGDKKPGDKLSCPICRKEITIADDEAMGLQKNFFMARLIEMVTILKPADKDPLCNICLLAEPEDSSAKIQPATMYCIDCRDNLCPECSMHHRKQKLSRDHKVISLGSEVNEEELLEKSALGFCDEHKKEQQKLYCVDCKMLACVLCFVESHRLHDCRNVSKVADELRPRIIADISGVSNHVTEMFTQKEQLENETTKFLTIITEVENDILRRNSELKELVDKSTASLLEELSAVKKQRLKEIENKKEDNETHLTILKTFQTYCNGIITKGTDSDVCRVVNDLCHRADELQKLHHSHLSQNLPSMKLRFEITKLNPTAKENIIGTISAWEGFNTMELDIQEDAKEKKKCERSYDDYRDRSDKERTLKKGKTGYNSRPEEEKPDARSKFDDQDVQDNEGQNVVTVHRGMGKILSLMHENSVMSQIRNPGLTMVVLQESQTNTMTDMTEEMSGLVRTPGLNVVILREVHTNAIMKETSGRNRIPELSMVSGQMWLNRYTIIWTPHLINIETWRSNVRLRN